MPRGLSTQVPPRFKREVKSAVSWYSAADDRHISAVSWRRPVDSRRGGGRAVTGPAPPRSMPATHLTISPQSGAPLGLGPRPRGQEGQCGVLEAPDSHGRVRAITELSGSPEG